MKKVLTRETLEEILDDAGLDPEECVYNWPSGMYGGYGHVSFALTMTDAELAQFFFALGHMLCYSAYVDKRTYPEGFANLHDMVPSGTDPLRHGAVTYFRGWELEPEASDE